MKQKVTREMEKLREEYINKLTEQYFEKDKNYLADMFIPFKEIISLEEFIKAKLAEREEQFSQIPKGKYQDSQKIIAEYQQKFVEFSCRLSPQIFEELKLFVPLFDNVFGEHKDRYIRIFDRSKDEVLNLSYKIDSKINLLLRKSDENFLEYTGINSKNWKRDYQWDEYRLCLHLLYLILIDEMPAEKREEVTKSASNTLKSKLSINSENLVKKPDKANQQKYAERHSKNLISEYISDVKSFDIEIAKTEIVKFLQDISPAPENSFQDFIILQTELINWAERNNFKKDWLLEYAYFFLSEYSSNPDIQLNEIKIPTRNIGSLKAHSFGFSFAGWTSENSIEEYEKLITESFNEELQKYFLYVSDHYNLKEIKHITRHKDSEYESIKWLIAWNEGISQPQIAKYFYKSICRIKDGLEDLAKLGLPRRIGSRGRKKNPLIHEKRLGEIKQLNRG